MESYSAESVFNKIQWLSNTSIMRLIRQMIYNASIITLFQELYKKYPHPIVIYDNFADGSFDIYHTVTALDSQWISKSLDYDNDSSDQHLNGINSLHVFCADDALDSVYPIIRDHILRASNSYRIQNIILFKEREPPQSVDIFAENERIHRNTMLCQRHTNKAISCWYWTKQIDRINPTLLDLLYEPINLNLLEIRINAQSLPPNALIAPLADRCIFVGLNAMVVAEILTKFNATPRYCNRKLVTYLEEGLCSKVDKINGDDALRLLRRSIIDRKVDFQLLQMVFDSRMLKYLFIENGVCNGPPDINMDIAALNENNNMRALVPTELSCITVIIPRADAAASFLRRMFYSVESFAFFCTVLLFTTGRIIISKSPLTEWLDIFYSTFVVYLNQTTLKPKTVGERILYGFLLALSVTLTVMLSGLIFTNMVNNPSSKSIQTVNDLAASNYKIFALRNGGNWMENLRDDIRMKVTVVNHFAIIDQLVTRNKTVALALSENILGLVKSTWDSPNLDSKHRNDYYQMREKLHCGYFAYRISKELALENEINQILRQMVQHGFISAFKKWTMHIFKLVDLFKILSMGTSAPINFSSTHGIFYLYLCGILLSSVVFLCERLYKRTQG